ncbi:flagellar filament capping protein FliD [Proteiniclasticum sp. SCR006]|uniref:Flagellar hook-associated protein 2 n=1 Tax=Proteiniclasticum aestuarii TaxID=2817862 RepID=A0A939HA47_9CLOT|nr:flagellar filament capping protein FliD [Proteiniclasticum aestuarii]MBO1265354.1 flagellar filament capping protein FliD [Proteiniclasticum aestuarii]
MSINFLGSYSGIDQSTIDQLMAVEKRPLIQLSEKKTNTETQMSAWNDVRTRLTNLFDKIKALQNTETFSSKKTSGGESATLTVSKNTPEGTYDISVSQLATRGSVVGGAITAMTSVSGDSSTELGLTGKFSINAAEDGSGNVIEVTATDTVRTISDKINAISKESGVRSAIIDNRLVLTNVETGNAEIKLADLEGGTMRSDLGLDTSTGGAEIIPGKNAKFTVNGVDVERTSNSVNDVIEYTTINLTKMHAEGQSDSIVVSKDTSKVEEAVKGFVDQYNSTMNFITDKLKAGTPGETASRGTLAGDSSLIRLQSTLRSMVTSSIANENTSIGDISQLGVSTVDKFGQLSFDASKLNDALNEDPLIVQNFFNSKNAEGNEIGFVSRINGYIDSFSSTTGIIKGKTDSFDRTLKDINKQVESFNIRMERKEAYYVNMFAKLDTAMMQAESQMGWLTSQISSMTPTKK